MQVHFGACLLGQRGVEIGLGLVARDEVFTRIDLQQQITCMDKHVVVDAVIHDVAGHLGSDRYRVSIRIGIVRALLITCHQPEDEPANDGDDRDDDQNDDRRTALRLVALAFVLVLAAFLVIFVVLVLIRLVLLLVVLVLVFVLVFVLVLVLTGRVCAIRAGRSLLPAVTRADFFGIVHTPTSRSEMAQYVAAWPFVLSAERKPMCRNGRAQRMNTRLGRRAIAANNTDPINSIVTFDARIRATANDRRHLHCPSVGIPLSLIDSQPHRRVQAHQERDLLPMRQYC